MLTYLIIAVTAAVSIAAFDNGRLLGRFALRPYRAVHHGEWYRLLSHGFVHGDWMHLFVNMFTFWSFGLFAENVLQICGYGSWAFLLLYFGGMAAASIYDIVRYREKEWYSSIGASGAVSAVLFFCIYVQPWEKILLFAVIPVPGIAFGLLYLAYCQYMARQGGDMINHNAHFYGAVSGLLLAAILL